MEATINILFVCLGNICRSPIAEATFKTVVASKNLNHLIQCDSAGTAAYHIGSLPDTRMRNVALEHGITLTHHARKFVKSDGIKFHYILAMDESNFNEIQRVISQSQETDSIKKQLYLYRMFDPKRGDEISVPDPYYADLSDFEEVYGITLRCANSFLDFLVEDMV